MHKTKDIKNTNDSYTADVFTKVSKKGFKYIHAKVVQLQQAMPICFTYVKSQMTGNVSPIVTAENVLDPI